jgi:hypothetical protein
MTTQAEAITRAGAHFAAGRTEREAAYQHGGVAEVARVACRSGSDRERDAVAAQYTALQQHTQGDAA